MNRIEMDEKYIELYNKYFEELCVFCRSRLFRTKLPPYMTEDIVNEAYVRLYNKWDECVNRTISANYSWLCKTIRFIIMDEHNRAIYRNISYEDMLEPPASEDEIGKKDDEIQYQYYMKRLSKICSQEDMILYQYIMVEKRPYKEVEDMMGISSVTLRSKVSRLKKKLGPKVLKLLEEYSG